MMVCSESQNNADMLKTNGSKSDKSNVEGVDGGSALSEAGYCSKTFPQIVGTGGDEFWTSSRSLQRRATRSKL